MFGALAINISTALETTSWLDLACEEICIVWEEIDGQRACPGWLEGASPEGSGNCS